MDGISIRLRPLIEADLDMFRRFATDPGAIGPDWGGFRDPEAAARRFAADNYLGAEDGRLIVDAEVAGEHAATGFVSWRSGQYARSTHFEIGIALLPEWRGRGLGWRAQAMLCDYLFQHTPVQRIQAGTQPENQAEQRSLVKAGFQLEGVIRSCEFRAGQWRDGLLYSRLRDDPAPNPHRGLESV
jgi:RimJ/RimL family protein N-acetyltransferase